jgi:hypothetical protein
MQDWKCTIRTPSNWLQTVYVEAYTREDAVAAAEHRTGGKCIFSNIESTTKWESPFSNSSASNSNDGAEISGGGILFLLFLFFMIAAWKYMLIIGAIAALIWGVIAIFKD